jgi:hypothetical protein
MKSDMHFATHRIRNFFIFADYYLLTNEEL